MSSEPTKSFRHYLTACNLLIAANVLVMIFIGIQQPRALLLPSDGMLIDMGANLGLLTVSGEYWRLVTCMFVHVGIIHLVLNMWGLWSVGTTAESLFGWRIFLLIYFFSGIIGSLTSILHDPLQLSVGASGAILGVFGSLLAFMYVHRDQYPKQTLMYYTAFAVGLFLACVVVGMYVPGIDNFAHLGGFVGGAFAGLLLARLEVRETWRIVYAVPVMALMGVLWAVAIHHNFEDRGFESYSQGMRAFRAHEFPAAIADFSAFIDKNQSEPLAYYRRGVAYAKIGELELAAQDYDHMIRLAPRDPEAYNSRAWAEAGLQQYERAIRDATISLEMRPRSTATLDTRGYAYGKLGETAKALEDFGNGLKIDPADKACHYHRMRLLESLGKKSEAAADQAGASGYEPEVWES